MTEYFLVFFLSMYLLFIPVWRYLRRFLFLNYLEPKDFKEAFIKCNNKEDNSLFNNYSKIWNRNIRKDFWCFMILYVIWILLACFLLFKSEFMLRYILIFFISTIHLIYGVLKYGINGIMIKHFNRLDVLNKYILFTADSIECEKGLEEYNNNKSCHSIYERLDDYFSIYYKKSDLVKTLRYYFALPFLTIYVIIILCFPYALGYILFNPDVLKDYGPLYEGVSELFSLKSILICLIPTVVINIFAFFNIVYRIIQLSSNRKKLKNHFKTDNVINEIIIFISAFFVVASIALFGMYVGVLTNILYMWCVIALSTYEKYVVDKYNSRLLEKIND